MFRVKIKSKYNRKEKFDYMNVPDNFESVTDKCIEKLRKYCIRMNEKEYKNRWLPGSLLPMLGSVAGRFDQAHARLEGDYSLRKSNLEKAYIAGVADVGSQIMVLESGIAEHDQLLERYVEAYEKFSGKKIGKDLRYSDSQLVSYKSRYGKL